MIGIVAGVVVPRLLAKYSKNLSILEKRFRVRGTALGSVLRQYSHVVLVPELTARHVLKLDSSMNNVKEELHKNESFVLSFKVSLVSFFKVVPRGTK